jgi:hypothetical protein
MDPLDDSQDVIENGDQRDRPARRPEWASRGPIVLAVSALAVGLIAGYLGGQLHNRAPAPSRPTATTPAPSRLPAPQDLPPDLTATGNRCAVQHGTTLQLGVEVANQSDQAVAVGQFRAVLPIGGLKATVASIGTCGALPAVAPTSLTLPAGGTEWLTITFHILERCPQPFPVQFVVDYTAAGKIATTQLDEFPDLGQVTFSGCPSTQ